MTRLTLQRLLSGPSFMHGDLSLDGAWLTATLEDELRENKVAAETAIPAGSYRLELFWSPKFSPRLQRRVLRLIGVPRFTDILFHPGNRDTDTAGCILPGIRTDEKRNWLDHSTVAFNRVMDIMEPKIDAGEECWIDIHNAEGARYVDTGNPATMTA